jgi:protein-tyrosine phosphatase
MANRSCANVRESAVDAMSVTAKLPAFLKQSLKRMVPERILRERAIILRLGTSAGRFYARTRLLDTIGINPFARRLVPPRASSFVFVCFGNIMRSPMANALLKRSIAEGNTAIRSDSAGLHAIPGLSAHPSGQVAANELGISLADHQAKLLTAEMIEKADAIFAMDFQNLSELLTLYPESKNKIFMLSAYADDPRIHEISDPFFGDIETARRCYRLLQTCVQNLVTSLTPSSSSE